MCFFFGLPSKPVQISNRFQKPITSSTFENTEKINGFAHPKTLLISNDNPNEISDGIWGFLPTWAKDTSFQKNTLNARIETINELPTFKNYTQNRCLIPANYFFDWRHEGKEKIGYKVYNQEDEIFCFAGLYSDWVNPVTLSKTRTYTIITTAANELMQYVHNTKMRMPIVLHKKEETYWLQNEPIANFAFPYQANLVAFTY